MATERRYSMSQRRRRNRRRRAEPASPPSRWRRTKDTIDSFGGFLVVGSIAATIVVLVVVVIMFGPTSPSDDPLLGDAVNSGPAAHVDPSEVPIGPVPQAGGPHAPSPLRQGIYSDPVSEPRAIHSLEHGMIWITYQPNLLSSDDYERLEDVADGHSADVILSPRLENVDPIVLVSWGQRLIMDELDTDLVDEFIRTNRNRSPEPGIR